MRVYTCTYVRACTYTTGWLIIANQNPRVLTFFRPNNRSERSRTNGQVEKGVQRSAIDDAVS